MVESMLSEAPTRPADQARAISPAAHLSAAFAAAEVTGARGVSIREVPFLTMVGVRVAPGTAGVERIEAALGTALPARCGEVADAETGQVLWLSPDEYVLVSQEQPAQAVAVLTEALAGTPGSVIDLSANRTTFELAGPMARSVLEKGCSLDLHPRVFAVGAAYVTSVGAVPVLLWKTADEVFRVMPRASFADFLGRWLVDAMVEYQGPELP